MINNELEYILCAAIWYKDLEGSPIVCGRRHHNIIHVVAKLTQLRTVEAGPRSVGDHEQGFMTSKNRFVNRKEAKEIAAKAMQVLDNEGDLYSEDLY